MCRTDFSNNCREFRETSIIYLTGYIFNILIYIYINLFIDIYLTGYFRGILCHRKFRRKIVIFVILNLFNDNARDGVFLFFSRETKKELSPRRLLFEYNVFSSRPTSPIVSSPDVSVMENIENGQFDNS